jgi:hemolysin activation/secretion protein
VVPGQALPPAATPGGAMPRIAAPTGAAEVPESAPELFPIPPTIERPLDTGEGERLFVKRFKLAGVEDRPVQGILREELDALVERMRVERQRIDEVGEDGFTDQERAEIAGFMREVVARPDLDMAFGEYQALVDRLRALKAEREAGMTIGEMQQIAAAVTQYYRNAGFVLAQAYIPAQEVIGDEVVIEVLEGRLGSVVVEGNESYSDELLAKPFRELIDAPVTASPIETAILAVNDYPGVAAFGVFQPGTQVGGTDLVLRVQDEKPFYATVRADNHGTRFTGEYRAFADFTWNNPTRAGDRLTGTVLYQFDPQNSWFGALEYERPLRPGLSFGLGAQKNPFDVGAELTELGFSGESEIFRAYLRKSLARSRRRNGYAYLGFKRSDSTSSRESLLIAEDRLAMLEADLTFDSLDTRAQAINLGSIGGAVGLGDLFGGCDRRCAESATVPPSRQGSNGEYASNDFWKLTGSYSRLQRMMADQSLLVRLDGQLSRSLLTSLEQFDIGGPASVRAYPVSEFLADSALFASLEYTFNAPGFSDVPAFRGYTWGEILRVSFFADYAHGRVNKPTVSDGNGVVNAAGLGAGLAFSLPGEFDWRLQYAHKLGHGRASDGDSARWWLDVTLLF